VTRRLVFKHTVEGLFTRAYGDKVTPLLREQFRSMGLDAPAVDAEAFGRAFMLLRDAVHPGVEPSAAERQMGARFLAGYFDTTMGSLVRVMLKVLSVEKALSKVPQSLMSGANYIEAKVVKVSEREVNLVVSDYSTSPAFMCGVVTEMVTRAGGSPQVDVTEQQGRALTIRVRW
jgi:uncharacterized protein (TIGR02265 family)